MGVIARMPLQFGLLTGKFDHDSRFSGADHRSVRLPAAFITQANNALQPIWSIAEKYHVTKTAFSLSYILSYGEVSTVIPGMRTADQVLQNVAGLTSLSAEDRIEIEEQYQQMR